MEKNLDSTLESLKDDFNNLTYQEVFGLYLGLCYGESNDITKKFKFNLYVALKNKLAKKED